MPIDTPSQALTVDELPTASANEAGVQALVVTASGVKKLPIQVLFEPYSLLIGSYQYYPSGYPMSMAIPLMGGVLDPADFDDNLQILKQRVPNDWILADGKVQLPLASDHVLQQDLSLQLGQLQEDAMQNVIGQFGGVHGIAGTGPFRSGGGQGGGPSNQTAIQRVPWTMDFSADPALRTADRTRERTINALMCIVTGPNTSTTTKTYYVIDAQTGVYAGWTITLPVGRTGEGIGYNAQVMTTTPPPDHNQTTLAGLWPTAAVGDPLGLAMWVWTRSQWSWAWFETIYRTFRIGGKDVFITADMSGVRMLGGDGIDSIVFTGTPSYNTATVWGSAYGVIYSCTSVVVNGSDFVNFAITGLPTVDIRYMVKGGVAILSMTSGGQPLNATWWANLEAKCPQDKLQDLQKWLGRMPDGMYNAANTNDTLDGVPMSRFYLYSSAYVAKKPTQYEIWQSFINAQVSDLLGIYAGALLSDFSLSNYISKEQRTFWLCGFQVTFEADANGFKWITEDGYYLRCAGSIRVGSQTNYYNQGQQVIYSVTPQGYFVGGPGISEINFTNGWSMTPWIIVKERYVMFSFSSDANYFSVNRINELIGFTPSGREADVQRIFEHMPKDFTNTLNTDNIGNNWGVAQARFWMQGNE